MRLVRPFLPACGLALALLVLGAMPTPARAAELLMFELQGCPWCRLWHREVGQAYPLSPEGRRAPLRIVDIKDGAPRGVRLDKAVTSSPTFVLVDGDHEIGRITGYPGADFFWGLLDGLLARLDPPPPPADPAGQRSL